MVCKNIQWEKGEWVCTFYNYLQTHVFVRERREKTRRKFIDCVKQHTNYAICHSWQTIFANIWIYIYIRQRSPPTAHCSEMTNKRICTYYTFGIRRTMVYSDLKLNMHKFDFLGKLANYILQCFFKIQWCF